MLSPLDEKAEVDEQLYEVSSNGTQTNASLPTPSWAFADELAGDSGKQLRELLHHNGTGLRNTPGVSITIEEKRLLAEQRAREQPVTVAPMSIALSDNEQNITSCMKLEELGRFEEPNWAFKVVFSARVGLMFVPNRVLVSDAEVLVMTFSTQSIVDTGGTLYYKAQLDEEYLVRTCFLLGLSFSCLLIIFSVCFQWCYPHSMPLFHDICLCFFDSLFCNPYMIYCW